MSRERAARFGLASLVVGAFWLLPGLLQAEGPGAIFPTAFVVEHALTQIDGDGSSFEAETIKDTYGGSWIVSERPDGSRLVIDFARREVTEIRPTEGRYSVIGFERMAELLGDLQAFKNGSSTAEKRARAGAEEPVLRVDEIAASDTLPVKRSSVGGALLEAPGTSHLRIVREGSDGMPDQNVLDVWFDTNVRFSQRSLDALEAFEVEVLGAAGDASSLVEARAMAIARRSAGGRLPLLTIRRLAGGGDSSGSVEDVVLGVTEIPVVPSDLVIISDGLHRTPHPLEVMARYARREAELDRLMGGNVGADR